MIITILQFLLAVMTFATAAECTLINVLGCLIPLLDLILKLQERFLSNGLYISNKFYNCNSLKTYLFLSVFNQLR